MPRFYCATPIVSGMVLDLPAGAARHVQVLRLQPGAAISLFHGDAGEFDATVTHMGRSTVQVEVGMHHAVDRQPGIAVHLAVGMPANDRMDWLVEKATELGVASIQPLMMERSVLRLTGERAEKKQAHWHSVAVAACEQCGGNAVPTIHPITTLQNWLQKLPKPPQATQGSGARCLLSLSEGSQPLHQLMTQGKPASTLFLSGPEGGLSAAEEASARQHHFTPVSLGLRTLRAETAALAGLAHLVLS